MMRIGEMTRKDKVEHYDTLKADRDRQMLAVHDLVNRFIVWSSWFSEGRDHGAKSGGGYRMGTARNRSYVIVQFRLVGQTDSIEVQDLDQYSNDVAALYSRSPEHWYPHVRALQDLKMRMGRIISV